MSLLHVDQFLKSINVIFDLESPARIAHFHPTPKSAEIIRAICGLGAERAFIVTAPYGSGKSIASAFSAQTVMASPGLSSTLETVGERLRQVNAQAADFVQSRAENSAPTGLVIAVEGCADPVNHFFREACVQAFARAKMTAPMRKLNAAKSPVGMLNAAADAAQAQGVDRLAIIWDEFGRHLEGLAARGEADELSVLQRVAEWANRQEQPIVTLTLLLHQSFFQYAGNLNQSARTDWKKIEGRFRPIQYVDDSRELYQLIARVVDASKNSEILTPDDTPFEAIADQALELGLFKGFEQRDLLAKTLRQAYPLDPAVLYMLPRLSARVAQNERTLFDFLRSVDLRQAVTLTELYDYFSPAMRADTALGGTHRHWLEVESALSKARSLDEERILKSACLLGLGLSGQRFRVGFDHLLFSVRGLCSGNQDDMEALLEHLVERKLLLHRRHNNDISVWHGTDADLRGRLEEEKLRAAQDFDLLSFLESEHPAPVWRPVEFNSRFGINRYFTGHYIHAAQLLKEGIHHPFLSLPAGVDGKVIYPLPNSKKEVDGLLALAESLPADPGLVLAIPSQPFKIFDVALEIASLMRLQKDRELTIKDPLVLPELQQMTDDARQVLGVMMDRLLQPGKNGPLWFSQGQRLPVASRGQLRMMLSQLMLEKFDGTPRILSEATVRHQLKRPMVNARKKVILAILERTGQADLGFEGTTPVDSMYRTVFKNTCLYRPGSNGTWHWAKPEELDDEGLQQVWRLIHQFFVKADTDPKSPVDLLQRLSEPPHGVRKGLFPLLFAAGLKAFPSALTILKNGVFLPDILASDIESICSEPECYEIRVFPMDDARNAYLQRFIGCFAREPGHVDEGDLIRACYDAVEDWKTRIPPSALTSGRLRGKPRRFQLAIRNIHDPAQLLFETLPAIAGETGRMEAQLIGQITQWRDALLSITREYEAFAIDTLKAAMRVHNSGSGDLIDTVSQWGQCFSGRLIEALDPESKALVRAAQRAAHGHYTAATFASAVSAILLGKRPDQWEDATASEFNRHVRETVSAIEEAAIHFGGDDQAVVLIQGRLQSIYARLVEVSGDQAARDFLAQLSQPSKEAVHDAKLA